VSALHKGLSWFKSIFWSILSVIKLPYKVCSSCPGRFKSIFSVFPGHKAYRIKIVYPVRAGLKASLTCPATLSGGYILFMLQVNMFRGFKRRLYTFHAPI